MISVIKVNKMFSSPLGDIKALDSISFKAGMGEIIGFLGPNGAGKTTTMRLLVGFYKPTTGEIIIDNKSPSENRIEVLEKIGYLPENNPLYPEMRVIEYLNFVASIKKEKNPDKIIEDISLDEVRNKKIETLSRGFKQRVGLAAALMGSPKILILDEPTSGLDPLEQSKLKNLIKKISTKKTIIFSTHILSEIEDVATRVVIINKGKIVFDGKKPKGRGSVDKLFRRLVK